MQPLEATDSVSALPTANALPQHSAKPSVNGDLSGFSHSSFHSNRPSIGGFKDRQGVAMPTINTGRSGQSLHRAADMQTPGTAFDMNFTPLLPSQLLMGSPFQPGSPTNFASPQFQSFQTFTPSSVAHAHNPNNHMGSPIQGQQQLSQHPYQGMMSATPMFFGGAHMQGGGYGSYGNTMNPVHMGPGLVSGTSRTVYLGNIPQDTTAEEILGRVRSGQIESVRLLPDKNCAFISFLDSSSAVHFHSDAILKKLSIRGQDIKIGWGKPSQVPSSVAMAVQQSGASRNVYLGNLPPDITEEDIREDLGKFGSIDTVKLVREKSIGFVHYLSISSAIKAVTQLPQEQKWQAPRRVFYGKDRCAYVSKTQQQNAAQYLGIAPGYAHILNSTDRDLLSNALAQQSVAAAAVATAAGGVDNLGNRTVYLGNIHPETTAEEICNVVRGGLLHHIRYIPDKHICFVTFIDPTSAASFYALSNIQGLMIHNRRLKIGWGKHSGALPPAIALAVSGGASRNVYVGNIDESWNEERLRQDFSEYGEIELVNTLREKSCAFVNFTNIANAIKAIEAVRGKDEYKRFKINFGKDRCGNPPRQTHQNQHDQGQQAEAPADQDGVASPNMNGNLQPSYSSHGGSSVSPSSSGISRPANAAHRVNGSMHGINASTPAITSANNNPLTIYLNQMSQQGQTQSGQQHQQRGSDHGLSAFTPSYQQHNDHGNTSNQYGSQVLGMHGGGSYNRESSFGAPQQQQQQQQQQYYGHGSSNSFSVNASNLLSTGPTTVGGMLAPSNMTASAKAQHARAISLPAFSQMAYNPHQTPQPVQSPGYGHHLPNGIGSMNSGAGVNGYGHGLAIHDGTLPRWAEEEVGS